MRAWKQQVILHQQPANVSAGSNTINCKLRIETVFFKNLKSWLPFGQPWCLRAAKRSMQVCAAKVRLCSVEHVYTFLKPGTVTGLGLPVFFLWDVFFCLLYFGRRWSGMRDLFMLMLPLSFANPEFLRRQRAGFIPESVSNAGCTVTKRTRLL